MSVSPVKKFQFSESFKKQGFLMLFVGIILIFAAFAIPPLVNGAGLAIVLGVIKIFFYSNKDILKIFENHLEIKVAPLAGLKIIKFDDIKSVIKENKFIVIKLNSNDKPIKLHERLFNKSEISTVYNSLSGLTSLPV